MKNKLPKIYRLLKNQKINLKQLKQNSMAIYDNDYQALRQKEVEERLQKEKLEKQLIYKKMTKLIGGSILGLILMVFLFQSCERIDAGHVGVKVNQYGDNKGVDDVVAVTGIVFYNPITTKVYEFPTFIQHKEYKGENSFIVNSKDGSEFNVSPIMNYSVQRDKVPAIFSKYRRPLEDIEEGFLKTAVYDAFRLATNKYTADELISNRAVFEIEVRRLLDGQLLKEGFVINQFTSNLIYPETFKRSIEAKNNAVQAALRAENEVKTAEAQAKIKVATAEGNAQAMLTSAKAEAESNRMKQVTLTPLLLQLEYINKWDGKLPVYGTVPQMFKNIN
jgi:regulator of protease activity HflC (stomatin/prohibitin superfamily)